MRDLEERKFQKIDENIATGIAPAGIDGFSEERNDGYRLCRAILRTNCARCSSFH